MMKTLFRNTNLVFVFSLALLLVACSGGGGGGDKHTQTKPTAKVNGSVVKGIIKFAAVDIYEIHNGAVDANPSKLVSTGDHGDYSFTLPADYSGPVKIVIHDNINNTATMKCDNPGGCVNTTKKYNFGADMPLGDVQLNTYVQNVSGGSTHTASVTPLTLMAAAYLDKLVANGDAEYNAQWIARVNSQVGNLLSINNIVTTTPPDITDAGATDIDSNALKYALFSAAITAIAQRDFDGKIADAIDALVESFTVSGHEGQLMNYQSTNSTSITLEELLNSARTLLDTSPIQFTYGSGVSSELSNQSTLAYNSGSETWTDAGYSPTSGQSELNIVKSFVADVRTWGHVIEDEINNNTGPLVQRMDMASNTLDIAGPLLSEAFDYAVRAAFEAYVQNQNIDLSTYTPDPTNPQTATGSANISGNTVTVVGTLNGTDFNVVLDFPADLVGTEFTLTMTSATVSNDQAEIVVTQPSSVTLRFGETVDLNAVRTDPSTPVVSPDSGSLDLAVAINELNVDNAVSFQGSAQVDLVGSKGSGDTVIKDVYGEVVYFNPSSVSLSGSLSSGDNSFNVNASATMDNADTFMPPNYWYPAIGSYAFSNNGDTLTLVAQDFSRTIAYDNDNASANYQRVVITDITPLNPDPYVTVTDNTYADMAAFLDSTHYAANQFWTYINGIGGYDIPLPKQASDWIPTGGTLDGILADPLTSGDENAANFRKVSNISVSFNAQLDNLPAATFSLTGNRSGLEDGELQLNIAYGNRSIQATGTLGQGNVTGTVTITNQDGVLLTIDLNANQQQDQVGSLVYDQTTYASIENVHGVTVIRYTDDYFETF